MGFFNQLKLLLWKNYTLKKRHPFVLLAELTIPLVIFFVLVGIRVREEPRRYETYNTFTHPLPSAGLLPFLNKFCARGHGSNSIFGQLIQVLSSLHKNNSLLGDNITSVEDVTASYQSAPQGDIDLLNSDVLWSGNISLSNLLLNRALHTLEDLGDSQLNPETGSYLVNEILGQNVTFGTLYGMYGSPQSDSEKNAAGFGAILASGLWPLIMTQNSGAPTLDKASIEKLVNVVAESFVERGKPVDYRRRVDFKPPAGCRFLVSLMMSSLSSNPKSSLLQYQDLVANLLCDDDKQAEREIALMILSNVNGTKALQSTYRNAGVQFESERFEIYTTFNDDMEHIFQLADHFLINAANTSEEIRIQESDDESNVLRFIFNIAPAICGRPKEQVGNSRDSLDRVDREFIHSSLAKLQVHYEMIKFSEAGLFMLNHNPHILFAPNTSEEVMRVVNQANSSFAMVDFITEHARQWLAQSEMLKASFSTSQSFQASYIFSQSFNQREQMCDQVFFLDNSTISCSFENGSESEREGINGTSNLFEVLMWKIHRIDEAARYWLLLCENLSLDIWKGFESERDAELWFQQKAYNLGVGVLALVAFETQNNGTLGNNVKYKIRQNSTLISSPTFEELPNFWMPTIRPDMAIARKYFINGFAIIQDLMERSIIEVVTNKTVKEPGLHLASMPLPCNTRDYFLFTVSYVMPLCMTVAWAYSVAMLVQYIVYEKEQGLKEVTRLMGVSNAVHWTAWFISAFLQMQVMAIVTALILKVGQVLPHSNLFLIWSFLTLYNLANIMFSFLVSVLYSKAKVAAACAGIIYFLTYVPYLYVSIMEDSHLLGQKVSLTNKYLASLCSTTAFGLGAKYFAVYEVQGTGVQFGNLGYSPFQNDDFHLTHVVRMMIIDSVLYALLAWYIEAVFPGKYGLPRPFYFPLMRSYWLPRKGRSSPVPGSCEEQRRSSLKSQTDAGIILEQEPVDLQLGVSIQNLTKRFSVKQNPAVDGLCLNLYQSQITALLGHNGAGKTTTMSILTGMIAASDGTATIYGSELNEGMDVIRKSLGMCPQHNVLFESLTVEEHLWFYASLKDMSANDIYYAVNTLLRDTGMELKRVDMVDALSGGMKRKLSVAIAFIGNAKLVILDEPTAGVDPYARRAIWDLIVKFKKGRTILLSTHFMDEADFLADRIAIMSRGKLKCCGSPMYLKYAYGSGYHLTIVKEQEVQDNGEAKRLAVFIQDFVQDVCVDWESSREVCFTLPYSQRHNFPPLLDALRQKESELKICAFGLRDTSLEEVFIKAVFENNRALPLTRAFSKRSVFHWANFKKAKRKLGSGEEIKVDNETNGIGIAGAEKGGGSFASKRDNESFLSGMEKEHSFVDMRAKLNQFHALLGPGDGVNLASNSSKHCTGNPLAKSVILYFTQLKALLKKRFLYARRNPKAMFTQIFLPSLFVSIAMTVAFYRPTSGSDPPVVMTPANYHRYTGWGNNIIPVFINPSSADDKTLQTSKVLQSLIDVAALGSNCLAKNLSDPTSLDELLPPRYPVNESFSSLTESCWEVRKNEYRLNKGYVPMNIAQTLQAYQPKTRDDLVKFVETAQSKYKDGANYKCKCGYEYSGVDCSKEGTAQGLEEPSTASFVSMGGDKIVFLSVKDENDFFLSTFHDSQLNRFGGYSIGKTRSDVSPDFSRSSDALKLLVKREQLLVYYDLKPRQAIPTFLNAINNVILRANVDPEKADPNGFGITLINHPLNNTRLLSLEYFETGTDVVIALFIIIAMSFVPASFVIFLVSERQSNAKHLQMVSGMSPLVFWISNYIWDMLNYLVPASACVLILIWFDLDAYTSKDNLPVVLLLFLLFGWSITPMMYPPSFLFSVPSTAYIVLIVCNLFLGVTAIMSVFLLDRFVQQDELLMNVRYVLENLFLLLPNYNLGRCLAKLAINDVENKFNAQIGQPNRIISALDWRVSGQALTAMAFEGIGFFLITILIQYRFFITKKRLAVTTDPIENEDVDVADERSRVLHENYSNGRDEIVFENLSKVYRKGKRKVLAVDRICLGVARGECFGLLGVNGAGKSSTFKMLTGNSSVSAGDAYIHGFSVVHEMKKAHSVIGYCPQFDALFAELTVWEHLQLYAAIRGMDKLKQSLVVDWVVDTLDLKDHLKKQSGTLSGGNKRKLSAAIALLGNPKVLLLDEPTSGMDAIARRFLWDLIKSVVKTGTSVILTSHSMEECEALCSRLAIMVNGHFKCLGSCQHLVNRFGDGYTVTVKVIGGFKAKQLRNFVRHFYRQYPRAVVVDRHQNLMQLQISSENLNLAKLFTFLELCVADAKLQDYSVSQTTLERVFINFAREQADEDINILREPLSHHRRTLSALSDMGSLASEAGSLAGNNANSAGADVLEQSMFVSLSPSADFHNNPSSPPPTQTFAPTAFLDDLHLDEISVATNTNGDLDPVQNSTC